MILLSLMATGLAQELLFTAERSTSFDDVIGSADEEWIVMSTGSTGQLHILSTVDWSIETMDVCTGEIGGATFNADGELVVGCASTGIMVVDLNSGSVLTEIPVDATDFYYAAMYGGNAYVLGENPSGGNPRVHLVDLTQEAEIENNSFPTTLGYGAAKDMELVGNFLIVTHGATSISKVDPVTGGATRDMMGPTMGTCVDVLPDATSSNALIAGGTGGVYRFLFASNELQFAATGADIDDASALVVHEGDLWVADADSDSLKSFTYASGGATMGSELLNEVVLEDNHRIIEMVSVQGYIVAGTDDGVLMIVGDAPWVEATEPTPSTLESSESFSFDFTSSESGSYSIRLNGTSNDDGTELISGTVVADESLTIELEHTETFIEGENILRIVVQNEDRQGHDAVRVVVDTPPTTPELTSQDVGFGDESILISSVAIVDSDLASYEVYVSTEPFDSDDYETGGPRLNDFDSSAFQIDVRPGEAFDWSLTGLINDQDYYLALRAVDAAGTESLMSEIQLVTPKDTLSASELSGESGGYCGIASVGGWLTISLSWMGIRRRRRFMTK